MVVKFSDWQLALVMGFVSLSIEWGGGGWAHLMGLGEESELGKVNAHGATNKQ